MALAGLLPEDRFALDVYNDPTLSTTEKLARLQAGMPPANDPTAAPVNDNGLPAIPAGPGLPVDALALGDVRAPIGPPAAPPSVPDVDPRALAAMGADANRPPVEGAGHRAAMPDLSKLPATVPPVVAQARALDAEEQEVINNRSLTDAEVDARKADIERRRQGLGATVLKPGQDTAPSAPGTVDPSQLQFAAPGAAPAQQQRPQSQFATVGTNTFQPVQRSVREGFTPTVELDRAGPQYEVEGEVAGTETETVIDPQTGKPIKTTVPAGLNLKATENPPNIQPLEKFTGQAAEDEATARQDLIDATKYAEESTMRAEQAAAERARKINEDAIAEANRRQAKLQERELAYQKTLAEVSNPNQPSGVDAYWARRDTGDRIMAGIAIALTELGNTVSGRQGNVAKDIIFKAIDEEIAEARQRRAMRLEGARTAYDLARDQFQSDTTRDAAMREMLLHKVASDFGRFQQFAQTPARKAQLEVQQAQWQQEADAATGLRQKLMADEVVRQDRFDQKRTIQIGGGKPEKPEDRQRRVTLPGGGEGYVRGDKSEADKVQTEITGRGNIVDSLGKLQRLVQKHGRGLMADPSAKSEYNSIKGNLDAELNVLVGQGAISKDDQGRINAQSGDPNAIIADNGAALQAIANEQRARVHGTIRDRVYVDPAATQPIIRRGGPSSFQAH